MEHQNFSFFYPTFPTIGTLKIFFYTTRKFPTIGILEKFPTTGIIENFLQLKEYVENFNLVRAV